MGWANHCYIMISCCYWHHALFLVATCCWRGNACVSFQDVLSDGSWTHAVISWWNNLLHFLHQMYWWIMSFVFACLQKNCLCCHIIHMLDVMEMTIEGGLSTLGSNVMLFFMSFLLGFSHFDNSMFLYCIIIQAPPRWFPPSPTL